MARRTVDAGRYYTSQLTRYPETEKKVIDYALNQGNPIIHKVGSEALDQLATKVRPNKRYITADRTG